ncbi:hypothetical protein F7Q92_21450, partial [Ideonella dechloratans]
MLSAFSVEHCPPSWWNTVRHQRGIVSAIAWNTQAGGVFGHQHAAQALAQLEACVDVTRTEQALHGALVVQRREEE